MFDSIQPIIVKVDAAPAVRIVVWVVPTELVGIDFRTEVVINHPSAMAYTMAASADADALEAAAVAELAAFVALAAACCA